MTRYTPQWLQAGSYAASVDRNLIGALWPAAACSGVAVTSSGTGMGLNVAPGRVAVPSANNTGSVLCSSDAIETLTLTPAPPANSDRVDLIICRPRSVDLDGTSTQEDFIFDIVAGVVGAPPGVQPATPAGTVALAAVRVQGGSATIPANMITDLRPQTLRVPAIVTPPALVSTRATLAAATQVPASAWLIVPLSTLQHNQGGGTWSGGRFTVPRRGLYLIAGAVNYYVSGTTYTTSQKEFLGGIFADAGQLAQQTLNPNILTVGTSNWSASCSTVALLNAGQVVDLRAWQNGPVTYNVQAGVNTNLSVTELPGAV